MKLRPEHFDFLGLICFPFILAYGIYELQTGVIPSENVTNLLVVIGVAGILIDGSIVYRFFIKKNR